MSLFSIDCMIWQKNLIQQFGDNMKLNDLIYEKDNRTIFPTLAACVFCYGFTGCYTRQHGSIENPELAFQVALVQHGYYLRQWEGRNVANKEFYPKACDCRCKHKWQSKNIGRCLQELTCQKCNETIQVDSSD